MKIKRLKLAADYLLKKSHTVSYPSHIGIETTNNCNLDCIMCPRHDMTRPVQDMDMELFKKIINDIKGEVEMVWLQHYGEPFLDKKIFEKIFFCFSIIIIWDFGYLYFLNDFFLIYHFSLTSLHVL